MNDSFPWPEKLENVQQLEEVLSRPWLELVDFFASLDGDLMILGASGKMGPTVARMARRAMDQANRDGRVIAVARSVVDDLAEVGVESIRCDLLDISAVEALPRVKNIIFMAGRKFGSTGSEPLTWAINVIVPYHVARTFTDSRIVSFSTGCVYPVMNVMDGGAREDSPPEPVGEYAMSCLGRERMFDYFSESAGEKVLQLRLNYAVEPRYGVLVDVATKVFADQPVDVTTGFANVIWQGDACNQVLLSLGQAESPAQRLNITGPETVSIRSIAHRFGELFGKEAIIAGEENGKAYLSDATQANTAFGYPRVPLGRVIKWTADWVAAGGRNLGKPTHFEIQDGKY